MEKAKAIIQHVWEKVKPIWQWFDDKGYNHNYDLGVADEIFSFYAVITLYVSYVDWIQKFPDIIATIIISIMVDIAFIIISVNQKRFWFRTMFYALAILSSMIGTELILEVSAHDLYPHLDEINSIKLGMLAWIGIREIATFGLNIIKRSTDNVDKMPPTSILSDVQNKALNIRQPYAEMILRGIKKIEYRTMRTNIRGRVYIYASLTPGLQDAFDKLKSQPGDFPTGVLVGTVEIAGCETSDGYDYEWLLANPERLEKPIRADNKAQPSWFKPFQEAE